MTPHSTPTQDSIWMSEIFVSIQGEGMLSGMPSTFVRMTGCNLRCHWCDTPETSWKPRGTRRDLKEIQQEIASLGQHHIVLTGGEPLLSVGMRKLARNLRKDGHHITLETSGSFWPDAFSIPAEADLFSISPKLRSSTPMGTRFSDIHEQRRYRPEYIRTLMTRGSYQLKFVASEIADLEEIACMVQELGANDRHVLIMPEGVSPEAIDAVAQWLVPECISRGWRFSDRLHIRLFGNQRGT